MRSSLQTFEDGLAHLEQRAALELVVQVIGRLLELAGLVLLGRFNDFVRHVAAGRDDDDQELSAVERHEIQPLERRHVRGGRNRKADLVRRARDLLRYVRQHVARPCRRGAAALRLEESGRDDLRSASS